MGGDWFDKAAISLVGRGSRRTVVGLLASVAALAGGLGRGWVAAECGETGRRRRRRNNLNFGVPRTGPVADGGACAIDDDCASGNCPIDTCEACPQARRCAPPDVCCFFGTHCTRRGCRPDP